ncbi:MAG TPA: M20 family metallopeptidase [Vicinamibacterales bacterium]|nr:M20 family metallopeptidase [Vicinamibacterales bacterium]
MHPLLAFCRSEQPWLLDTIESLVRLESPTTDKAAVDRCGAELARRIDAIGGRIERLRRERAGDHLRAEFGGEGPSILLLGHFDTVWPVGQLARMPLRREAGRLHGPGVFDMKAGIALGLLATRALAATGGLAGRRLTMLWTADEETGSDSSREAIEAEARRSAAVLVLEPSLPGGAVKTARKGCAEFTVAVHGIPAHAGVDPGKGASAIYELAAQIRAIAALQDLDRGVSVNVGLISGGSRANVIAEQARAIVDVRVPRREDEARLDAAFRALRPALAGTRVEVTGGFNRPPLERTAGVGRLYDQARSVAGDLGFELREGATGGGSDGNFTAALGIPTLDGLGAVGDGAHALHEHVEIDALAGRAALLAGLIARLDGSGTGG